MMTSSNLKRPFEAEMPTHPNKMARRCTSYLSQSAKDSMIGHTTSAFKDPSAILPPLSDDVATMIKDELHRNHHDNNHHHHHHQQQQQQQQHEQPVLTIRQTQICLEKLIKEREQKLREEYDKILISKLAEQYDTFVKYTHDHIEKRYNESNSHQASYLS